MNPMPNPVRECQCAQCLASPEHPDWQRHHEMNLFLGRLNEQQRRWYVALESKRIGYGGDTLLSQISGLDVETIRRGRRELESELAERPIDGVRLPGGGQPSVEKKTRHSSSN
jgi:hypothetical protein